MEEEFGRESNGRYAFQAFSRVGIGTLVEAFGLPVSVGCCPRSSSVSASPSHLLPGRRYWVGDREEARGCTANWVSARIPHPSRQSRDTISRGHIATGDDVILKFAALCNTPRGKGLPAAPGEFCLQNSRPHPPPAGAPLAEVTSPPAMMLF